MKKSIILGICLGLIFGMSHMISVNAAKGNGMIKEEFEIPVEVIEAANKYGDAYSIAPELLVSVAWHESRFKSEVTSPNGLYIGLMQIHPASHKKRMVRCGVEDLYDLDQNMHVAADYLSDLFEQYEETTYVLMAYSGDLSFKNGNISSYAENILSFSDALAKENALDKGLSRAKGAVSD